MLLLSRSSTLKTGPKTGLDLAMALHSVVNDVLDIDVGLSVGGPGYPGGTFIFSALVDDMAQAQSEERKLLGSKKYLDLTEKVAALAVSPTESRLRALVSMAPETLAEVGVGSTVSMITARVRGGMLAEAMTFGVEMVGYYNKGTNLPIAFLRNVVGDLGEVAWLGVAEDGAALDKALNWEATDAGYQERYAAAGDYFADGSAHRGLITRVA